MERALLTRALKLTPDASDRDILDRIEEWGAAAGEDLEDLSTIEQIRRGEHDAVSIDGSEATVSLYFPIKSGSETIDTLTIRRPQAKHIRKMQEAKGEQLSRGLVMLADLTGKTMAELDKLDGADVTVCMTVIGFLQRPPRRTGSKS